MKGLSIEEKASRYDEAIEKAKEMIKAMTNIGGVAKVDDIQYLFPELKESEDDKIRKKLIQYFSTFTLETFAGLSPKKIIAWLEKQGEQKPQGKSALEAAKEEKVDNQNCVKPTDKAEPKFKNGQWIVWQDKCYKVNYNGCGYELVDQNGLSTSLEYGTIDENAHIWDITKDAKDGDVLVASDKSLFIYDGSINENGSVGFYIAFAKDTDIILNSDDGCGWEEKDSCRPATKEQREQLEKAMADAGCTFDFEKKELKKIKQKSAWSKEDAHDLARYIEKLGKDYELNLPNRSYDIYAVAKDILKYIKPNRSEEKTAWSEEDESMRVRTIGALSSCLLSEVPEEVTEEINWLKSLRPQTTWKPSDEQIEILEMVLTNKSMDDNIARILRELREQLKKLKG